MSLTTDIRDIHEAIRDDIRRAAAQQAEADMAVAADALLTVMVAADSPTRAAIWTVLTLGERHQLAAAALRRIGKPVTTDAVLLWVEAMHAKFLPAPIVTAAMGAYERLADQVHTAEHSAATCDERRFFAAERRALEKAIIAIRSGYLPAQQPGGDWLVPSATDAILMYTVTRHGACSCPAGTHGRACWHAQAVVLIDVAIDLMGTYVGHYDTRCAARSIADCSDSPAA